MHPAAHLTVLLPRQRANQISRPIIVRASEIDILLELKPEGKVTYFLP